MTNKKMSTQMWMKLVIVALMGVVCMGVTGCGGGDNPPVVIQQPAPAPTVPAPIPPVPPVVQVPPSVPPTVPTTVITQYPTPIPPYTPTPVAQTPVTTIVVQIPNPPLATPPPPTYIPQPVPATPVPPIVQVPPPYDPNCPPWWARPRPGKTVTIVKIRPGSVTIIQKTHPPRWDPWRRGPAGWWNPLNPQVAAVPPQPTQLAQAPVQ